MKVICQEIFAPVFSIVPYHDIEDAIAEVNDSIYGLQAGVFTNALDIAHLCIEKLEVGGVIINVGPYIKEIPEEVIQIADAANFPVFELPWEVKIVEVTQEICSYADILY